jgi:O-antigen ligase
MTNLNKKDHLNAIGLNAEESFFEFEAFPDEYLNATTNRHQSQLVDHKNLAALLQLCARLMFAATIVLIPFRFRFELLQRPVPPVYQDYTDFLLFLSDITLIAMFVFWITGLILRPRSIKTGPHLLTVSLGGLSAFSLLSIVFSIDRSLSLYNALRMIMLGGLYLYIVNEITHLGQVIWPVLIQVFIQTSVAAGQFIQGHSLGLKIFGEFELNPDWNGVSVVTANGIRTLRAYGLTDHPNILGGCLACALILIAGWIIQSQSQRVALVASIFFSGTLGLFFTFSRSAWLALGLAIILMMVLLIKTHQETHYRNLTALIFGSFLLLAPFLYLNLNLLGVRFNWQNSFTSVPQENQSIGERQLLEDSANQIFADHALTGIGLAAFPLALRQMFPEFPVNYQPAHLVLLDVATETGIFGALFYILVVAVPFGLLLINRQRLNLTIELLAATGLLLIISVISLFDYYPWLLAPGRLWFWFALGLWGAIYQTSLEESSYA